MKVNLTKLLEKIPVDFPIHENTGSIFPIDHRNQTNQYFAYAFKLEPEDEERP
jgi:hypothetical protein